MSATVSAYASEEIKANIDLATVEVNVSGTLSSTDEEVELTLVSLKSEYDIEDLSGVEFDSAVNYIAYVKTDADGTYSYKYKMKGSLGDYQLYVIRRDTQEVFSADDTVFFCTKEELEEISKEFNEALDKNEIEKLIEKYNEIFLSNSSEQAKSIADYIWKFKDTNGEYKDYTALQKAYKEALLIEKIQKAATTDEISVLLDENEDILNLSSLPCYDAYENVMDDNGRKAVLESFLNFDADFISEYVKMFNDKTILAAVKYMPNWSNINKLLTENRDSLTKLNYSSYEGLSKENRIKVDKEIVGNEYTSLNKLCDAVNEAVYDVAHPKKDAGGSGKTSGGSGQRITVNTPSTQVLETTVDRNNTKIFNDIENVSWAEEAITNLYKKGIVNGKAVRVFEPNAFVTREEFVKMIVIAMDIVDNSKEISFEDTSKDAWYYDYIKKAYSSGIINGINDNSFGIGYQISRQDMAVILCRALEKNAELTAGEETFADAEEIASYATECVSKLTNAKIINGMENGSFAPNANATRAQAVVMLYNALKYKGGK